MRLINYNAYSSPYDYPFLAKPFARKIIKIILESNDPPWDFCSEAQRSTADGDEYFYYFHSGPHKKLMTVRVTQNGNTWAVALIT